MIKEKPRYPYIGHHRRFTLLKPQTRPTPAVREIERLQRENAELRATIRHMTIWAEMDAELYDPIELLDRIHEIGSKVYP